MNAQLFNYLLRITSCSIICLIYLFYNHKRSKEYQKTVDNLENQLENLEKERLELMQENEKLRHTINRTNIDTMPKIPQPLHKFPQLVGQVNGTPVAWVSNGISDLKTALNNATMDFNTATQMTQMMAAMKFNTVTQMEQMMSTLHGNHSVQECKLIWGLK